MRLLIYGDIGGSGGYVRYIRGLLGNGNIPGSVEATLVCATSFYRQLGPLAPRLQVRHLPDPSSGSRIRRYLWYLSSYPRLVSQIRPDIEFYPSGQLRVYLRRARTVATCHNLLLFDPNEMARFEDRRERRSFEIYRDRQAHSFQQASGVIFLSEYSRQVVLKAVPGIKCHTVIAHGLDPEFNFAAPREYFFGMQINLLYVSSVHHYKHHPQVVSAVKAVRQANGLDLRLRLVGGGAPPALERLQRAVRELDAGSYVDHLGEMDRPALVQEYRKADLFIFASSSETFGIALLEAMGARLPIACSARAGLPDLLKDAGVYFDPEDVASIESALVKLLDNSEQRRAIGEKAHLYSQEYTWERCAQQTFQFIEQASHTY